MKRFLPIKIKKLPYHITLTVLTFGASLILGFLSFGGMLALSPILPFAFAAFALSVAYEGEIYLQSIKGALNKLFKHNYMKRRLSDEYLQALLTDDNFDIKSEDCPQFFKDYAAQCQIVMQFEGKTLDSKSRISKKQEEKVLNDMEKWFARQLISQDENNILSDDEYQKELQIWLSAHQKEAWVSRFQSQRTKFHFFKVFSTLSAVFMGLGTTYLLMDAFSAIPLVASLSATTIPFLIVPMAIIAGIAYGMLTYNAITDLLLNNKVRAMYQKIRADLSKGVTPRNVLLAITAGLLVVLTILLTACTAGTWWTVVKEAKPLFSWMSQLPEAVMGIINPIITGISTLIFNFQNSAESLETIDGYMHFDDTKYCAVSQSALPSLAELKHWLGHFDAGYFRLKNQADDCLYYFDKKAGGMTKLVLTAEQLASYDATITSDAEPRSLSKDELNGISSSTKHFQRNLRQQLVDLFNRIKARENKWQMLNPFRLVLILSMTPLRILLFLGHLVSISVMSNRVPGVSEVVSALLGFVSEFFEDLHFFVGHAEGGCCGHHHHDDLSSFLANRLSAGPSHNHDLDLPTRLLKMIFYPIYQLAAYWDWGFSQNGPKPLSYEEAWNKQRGVAEKDQEVHVDVSHLERPSSAWRRQHAVYRIDRHIEKQLSHVVIGRELAKEKVVALKKLEEKFRDPENTVDSVAVERCIQSNSAECYKQHRFFATKDCADTSTQEFLHRLPSLLNAG